MVKTLVCFLALLVSVAGLALADESDPRKPDWWPKADASEFDLNWPPPRPPDWPEGKPWPPLREIGEDPGFWTDLYGEVLDPKTDPRLKSGGRLGSWRFRGLFRHFDLYSTDAYPGCGLHNVMLRDTTPQKSCTPYPVQDVRANCTVAFNLAAARTMCARHCALNPPALRCSQGRLFEPPADALWGCVDFKAFTYGLGGEVEETVSHWSQCIAYYLCDCMEL